MPYDPYAANAGKNDKSDGKFLAFEWGDLKPKFFKIKEAGDYSINILPYNIATKKHPDAQRTSNAASVGEEVYALDFWTHGGVGPKGALIICPKGTWGKPCPVCELAEKMKREHGDKAREYTSLKPKHRVLYNIMKPGEDSVMLFEESYSLFEGVLIERSATLAARKGKRFIKFADKENIMDILFSVKRESFSGKEFNKFSSFDFETRDEPRTKADLAKAIPLDKYMKQLSYEEIEKLLYGAEEETPQEDEATDYQDDDPTQEVKGADAQENHKEAGQSCPHGRTFAKGFNREHPVCGECRLYTECKTAFRALNNA